MLCPLKIKASIFHYVERTASYEELLTTPHFPELVNHLVVARVWGPTWAGVEITGYTDNQSAMHLLRHGRSRSPLRLDIAREFANLQQYFHFLWQSEYVNTKDNVLSDCLSRWGSASARETFAQHTAGFHISEIFIPDSFLKINRNW